MNNCFFDVSVPRNAQIELKQTDGKKPRLFIPLVVRKYMGPDKEPRFTSIPCVFYDGYAEMMAKVLKPGMRLSIRAEYNSFWNGEKDLVSFVVQEHEIVHFPSDSDGGGWTDEAEDGFDDDSVDDDEFPF